MVNSQNVNQLKWNNTSLFLIFWHRILLSTSMCIVYYGHLNCCSCKFTEMYYVHLTYKVTADQPDTHIFPPYSTRLYLNSHDNIPGLGLIL